MATAGPRTVLCIDNEKAALTLRRMLLEQAGYKVLSATNAVAAFKLFKSQTIDLLISDHLLKNLTASVSFERSLHAVSAIEHVALSFGECYCPGFPRCQSGIIAGSPTLKTVRNVALMLSHRQRAGFCRSQSGANA